MNNKVKIVLIGAGGAVAAAIVVAVVAFTRNEPPPKPPVAVTGNDRTAIVPGSTNVTIDQSTSEATDSSVRVVDVSARKTNLDVATIDLELRNAGDTSAFLKRLELVLDDSAILDRCQRCPGRPVQPTASYDITLRDQKPMSISQAIGPRAVDRFTVAVQAGHFSQFAVYKARLRIVYDQDNKVVTTPEFMLPFGPEDWSLPESYEGACVSQEEWAACTQRNRELLRKLGYTK